MRNKKRILALLLAGVLAFGGLPITASAANNVRDGARPANGTTVSQPFPEKLFLGEHNSTNGYTRFRIPALTTAADGTLVAATDIRWDKCGDGGGIDTVVSRSTDDGENWSYTVANYLGDRQIIWEIMETSSTIIPAHLSMRLWLQKEMPSIWPVICIRQPSG